MNDLKKKKLIKEMSLGKVVWIQSPSGGSAVFFTKKLLNGLGIPDRDLICITASQFIRFSNRGFSPAFLRATRMLLIRDVEKLPKKTRVEFLSRLSDHQMFKDQFNLNLLVIASDVSNPLDFIQEQLDPYLFRLFEEGHPIGINEKIHEFIENASAEFKKPIWGLSVEAAEYLESAFIEKGEDYLRRLIFKAIKHSTAKKLVQQDLDVARYSMLF